MVELKEPVYHKNGACSSSKIRQTIPKKHTVADSNNSSSGLELKTPTTKTLSGNTSFGTSRKGHKYYLRGNFRKLKSKEESDTFPDAFALTGTPQKRITAGPIN